MKDQRVDKNEFLDLCGPYALGALDRDDAARFRAAIPHADAEMRAAMEDAVRLAEQLSLAAPEAAPSPAVKARLMSRIRSESAPAATRRGVNHAPDPRFRRESFLDRLFGTWLTPRPGLAAAFSLLVLSVGLVAWSVSLRGDLARQRATIDARDGLIAELANSLAGADSVKARLVALQDSLARKEALLALLRCPAMREILLAGQTASPDSASAPHGKVMWDPDHGFAVLQVALPREPKDKDYQLWMIRDGKPVSAGVFHIAIAPDSLGALYRLDRLAPTEARGQDVFAITLEPKGGVPKPTGAMVLSGGLEI
jgi:anti-sigma-K factor RskA